MTDMHICIFYIYALIHIYIDKYLSLSLYIYLRKFRRIFLCIFMHNDVYIYGIGVKSGPHGAAASATC